MGVLAFLKGKFQKKQPDQYDRGLSKSRASFGDKLAELAKRYKTVNSDYFEELEQILVEADVGVALSLRLIEKLLDKSKKEKINDPSAINEELIDMMFVDYVSKGEDIENEIRFAKGGPTVLLVVGVNGVGKTTTIAKLAYRYGKRGKKCMFVAADTFRAGAVEQLKVWASRLEVPIVCGKAAADPASVAYDGALYAKEHGIDLCIVDTAGRLQNKSALMDELVKTKRVLSRAIPGAPHETFLVVDATTGQNGVEQASAFKDCTDLSGVVITKMDGTSKGGIILSIRDEIGVPVRFIGLGEKMDDLEEFDLDKYLHGLLLGGSK
ncbi:MAG: signal recognition particle-docking protein FtsY [Bacilli bacterium]|jgi:fused signal recognition particle receptor|nr:signal recognition particle-docking protein FtsY [Bacilli bacterium]